MSEAHIQQLEEGIHQEEKRFLMEKYVSMLLMQLALPVDESGDEEELDERTVESLQVARPHVNSDLARQIAEFLSSHGHEVEEIEEIEETEDEDAGDLFGV